MIIKLRALCGEVDDFLREIEIDGNSTFLDLHNFIQDNLKFDEKQMASFFMTDYGWNKEQEITLLDMTDGDENGAFLMEKSIIEDHLTKVKERFIYVFDLFAERALFFEVIKIAKDKSLEAPICSLATGVAPLQILMDDPTKDIDSVMYDDDSFDSLLYGGELDEDDFEGDFDDEFGGYDQGGYDADYE